MAIWLGSEAQPPPTREARPHGLESVNEDNQSRVSLASPEDLPEHSNYFDFGHHQTQPKRSPTYPFIPPGPTEAHILKSLSKAGGVYHLYQKLRVLPPEPTTEVHDDSNLTRLHRIRHSSTVDTKNSDSFEHTAVWDQKAILSLDGGGIRGYSALLILQELMKVIGRIEREYACGPSEADGRAESSYHPLAPLSSVPSRTADAKFKAKNSGEPPRTESSSWLPCHYFDYIAGTSTGGLIGIMLGRLRMNVDDCIAEYEKLGSKVFGHSRKFHLRSPLFWPRDKYNYKVLESVVRDVVRRRVPKVDEFPGGGNFAFDENRCRTVVVAYQQQSKAGAEKPYLFRTYKNLNKGRDPEQRKLDRNPDMAHDIPIWQVARATSAAPTYFKPPKIDGLEYIDGGFGANNPCAEIYDEVRKMNNDSKKSVRTILSIGTGKNNEARRFKGTGFQRYFNYLNFARKWASDSEQTHLAMLKAKKEVNLKYFRLNVEEGLDLMKLDEWRARGSVRTKLGENIGALRSSPRKDGKDNKAVGTSRANGQGDNLLKEKHDHLPNGTGTFHEVGNGYLDHTGQETLKEAKEQASARSHVLDTAKNTSTTHLEPTVNGASTNGHPPSLNIPVQEIHSDADSTKVPKWFQPKNLTLEAIRKYTEDYLSRPETIEMIEQCAKLLVDGRRGRAKSDPQRWERACFGTWYQCKESECPRGEKEYVEREQLRRHLLDKHKTQFAGGDEGNHKLNEALDAYKIVVY